MSAVIALEIDDLSLENIFNTHVFLLLVLWLAVLHEIDSQLLTSLPSIHIPPHKASVNICYASKNLTKLNFVQFSIFVISNYLPNIDLRASCKPLV